MWSSPSHGITSAPNFGRFMSYARFHGIRLQVPWAMTDLPSVHKDGWSWFRQMLAEFNTNLEAMLGVLRMLLLMSPCRHGSRGHQRREGYPI